MEATLMLATLVRRFRFELPDPARAIEIARGSRCAPSAACRCA